MTADDVPPPLRHLVPLFPADGRMIEIEETETPGGKAYRLKATFARRTATACDDDFEEALHALVRGLPAGIVPQMCRACRYGWSDLFGSDTGRDAISCFREAKELALDLEQNLKHASDAAFAYMGRHVVDAFDRCDEFEPSARFRQAGDATPPPASSA